ASPLCPYTTLFRSGAVHHNRGEEFLVTEYRDHGREMVGCPPRRQQQEGHHRKHHGGGPMRSAIRVGQGRDRPLGCFAMSRYRGCTGVPLCHVVSLSPPLSVMGATCGL